MKSKVAITLALGLGLVACNRVSFQKIDVASQKLENPTDPANPGQSDPDQPSLPTLPSPTPVTPLPNPTPTPSPTPSTPGSPVTKSGTCANQESILSCLKCDVPNTPPTTDLSSKAKKLAKIMSMACQYPNKSYPEGWTPPSTAEVRAHLEACTPELYPETAMTDRQVVTINKLLDENDESIRARLFKGLWYHQIYTSDFENYFGLDSKEAAYVFCLDQGNIGDVLYTAEYMKAVTDGQLWWHWLQDPEAQARWRWAQMLRKQLMSCLNQPASGTSSGNGGTPTPNVTCDTRSFEGLYNLGGENEISMDLANGYKVAVETSNACVQITDISMAKGLAGQTVKIAAFRCR